MKYSILIHASLDLIDSIKSTSYIFDDEGLNVLLPDLTRYQHIRDEEGNHEKFNIIKNKLSRQNSELVKSCDAIYIINKDHRGVKNYVGGNSFFEMSIAFYLNKPIFLANPVPEGMFYTEEIYSFFPVIVGAPDKAVKKIRNVLAKN